MNGDSTGSSGADDRRRAHGIFMDAIEHPAEDRSAFVDQACAGDARLAREVNRLLSALGRTTEFLEAPVLATRSAASSEALAHVVIPGYTILRTLGMGGMATVYEAEQDHPRRRVAVKVMHQHLAGTSASERFLLETEVLATLKHPGIARIYGAGTFTDASGLEAPYFSMELVDGAEPITRYADHAGLAQRGRLELFLEACDAVSFGHRAGVIHRDLKPSNILVDAREGPKLIDFGIARSLAPGAGRLTLDADRDRLIGTLNYMSPEQCGGGAMVDTRSDVYALGVVLFELVTGRLPHELGSVPLPKAIQIKQSMEAPRCSTFRPQARGDLDAIVARALELDPDRRYMTAEGFAADIRRLLNDEPVQARAQTTLYQLQKLAKRHRAAVAAAAAILLLLVVGVVVTSRMAVVASRAQRAAEAREKELGQVVELQRSQLDALGVRNMAQRLDELTAAQIRAGADGLEGINFATVAAELLKSNLLEPSHQAINEALADQPELRARMLSMFARTMLKVGLPDGALAMAEESLELRRQELGPDHEDTLQVGFQRGQLLSELGRYDEAVEQLTTVLDGARRVLGPTHNNTLLIANVLGGAHRRAGNIEEGLDLWTWVYEQRRSTLGPDHDLTLMSLNNLGVMHATLMDFEAAESAWRELAARRKAKLGGAHEDFIRSHTNLALLLLDRGYLTEAVAILEEALATLRSVQGDEHPDTLSTMMSCATAQGRAGDLDRAESLFAEAYPARQRIMGPEHAYTILTRARWAELRLVRGETELAERELRAALDDMIAALGESGTYAVEVRYILARALAARGAYEEAIREASIAVEDSRALSPELRLPDPVAAIVLGQVLLQAERYTQAEEALGQALELAGRVFGEDAPRTAEVRELLAAARAASN